MESLLNTWSDELLRLFLFSRNVAIAESSAHDHQALVALVQASANLPIVPAQGTPASIFDLLTLQQLNFYLKQKRGHPVNSNSAWLRFAPPKQGRNKRDALRAFALKEYARDISGKQSELDRFDVDIADTLRQPHTIHQVRTELTDGDDERFGVMGAYLLDDDIEVLYSTWGIKLDPQWSREEKLLQAQKTGTLLATGSVATQAPSK